MLVFHSGQWLDIPVKVSDPIFTDGHRREMATMIAAKANISYEAAAAAAEKVLYMRLCRGLVPREEHGSPKN